MCDFSIMEKALKIVWVDRMQDQTSTPWKVISSLGSYLRKVVAYERSSHRGSQFWVIYIW